MKERILKGIALGYPLIPTDKDKRPLTKWKGGVKKESILPLSNIYGIAIETGNDIELIDFDLKYDITNNLYSLFCDEVKHYSDTLYNKMYVQTTVNNGFHWMYKCEDLTDGNLKLARREATTEEKITGDKVKVLIETRGNGGYVIIYPTIGYKIIQGSITKLNTITRIERDYLINLARSYNSYGNILKNIFEPPKSIITPFDDYDNKVSSEETIDILKNNGWKEVIRTSNRVSLLRPGDTKSKHSGYFELDKDRFSVFTTSSEFEPETRYKKSAVYCVLNHNSDWNEGAKELYKLGYGRKENIEIKQKINKADLDNYIVDYDDIWKIIDDYYSGKMETGLDTGMDFVDHYFRFRKNTFYTITAKSNVGKTTIVQYLQIMGSIRHGLKWLIWAAENSEDDYAETLLGFYLKENPRDVVKNNPEKHFTGRKFIENHFFFLKDAHNLEDVLNISKYFYKNRDIYAVFIDPINSTSPRKDQENWDYSESVTAGRKIVNFRKKYCSVWISLHPTIGKQREPGMPSTSDSEFGSMMNKTDIAIVLDRDRQAVVNNVTQMKIDKVRSKRLGCNITPDDHYITLNYYDYFFEISAPKFNVNGSVERRTYRNPF